MKKIFLLVVMMLSTGIVMSQDAYLQEGNEKVSEKAKMITDQYVDALGLRAKQELLFRKKVEEYLIREQEIKSNSEGEQMLGLMVTLRQNEEAEMADILTRIQLQEYKKVRPKIQPLAKVKQ